MQRLLHRRSVLRFASAIVPLAVLPFVAWADQPGQHGAPGTSPAPAPTPVAQSPSVGDIFIGEVEKRLIASYYQRHLVAYQQSPDWQEYNKGKGNKKHKHKGLPPGIAKKGTLPPGIAKQLARNNQLPPGLDYHPLPHDLIVQLPPLQPGYQYRIVNDRVMLIQAASNLILDVMTVAALEILN